MSDTSWRIGIQVNDGIIAIAIPLDWLQSVVLLAAYARQIFET